jgi:hypothetical protein
MPTPTVTVTIDLTNILGEPLEGVAVTARMDKNDLYDGIVIAGTAKATTNAGGIATMELFPNALPTDDPPGLGTTGSIYRFTASVPGGRKLDVQAVVPNQDVDLHSIVMSDDDEQRPAFTAGSIRWDVAQSLSGAQQQQARDNIGLGEVDDTSDEDKPVSTAQAAADATVLATAQAYADALAMGLWDDRGSYDASGNTFPAAGGSGAAGAIKKGDIWTISVAGVLGGHAVNAGDTVRALADAPGQTDANWAIAENNIGYVPANSADLASEDAGKGAELVAKSVFRVENVAALRALAPPGRKTVVFLEGYYTPGDGGGGMLVWMTTSAKVDNGGTVFRPDTAPANGRWERDATMLPLKWFGAKGDFNNEDTTAINNWKTAMSQQYHRGGIVDPGRYKHTTPLTWSNYRNLFIDGSGGNFGDATQIGATFEFVGDPVAHVTGGVFFKSVLNVVFKGVGFINRTTGIDYHLVVGANDSPSLSSHILLFDGCSFGCGLGIAVAQAGVLAANAKFVKFRGGTSDYKSDRDFRFGLDIADSPNTLMGGTAASCSIEGMLVANDIDLRNVGGLSVGGNDFGDRSVSAGAASITVSGDERVVGVKVKGNNFAQDRSTNTDTRPAIDTGCYAGTANLAPASGWDIEGNTFRDRAININIARGGVRVGANVHQLRNRINPGISVGINIEATVAADAAIEISPANDFSMADANNLIPIVDNRASVATDQVIFSGEVAADGALAGTGGYQTVITGNTTRPLRGGKYRLTYHTDFLASSNGGGLYKVEVLVNAVEYGCRSRVTCANSESGTMGTSRIIKLAGTTSNATITMRISQETVGTAATIRGASGSLGITYCQLEELP